MTSQKQVQGQEAGREVVGTSELRLIAVRLDKARKLMPPRTEGLDSINPTFCDKLGTNYHVRVEGKELPHSPHLGRIIDHFRGYLSLINSERSEPITYAESIIKL